MDFSETPIHGAYLITLKRIMDQRGSFAKVWSRAVLEARGLRADFVDCNSSLSRDAGTIRGLHYQAAPHEECKLVQCIAGAVYDVVIDLRPGSPTLHRWTSFVLRAGLDQLVYIPPGCAHGVQAMHPGSEILYWSSATHVPEAERGIRWNDPFFAISWPMPDDPVVSAKDAGWPDFSREPIVRETTAP